MNMDNVILKSTTPISKEIEERIKEKNGNNLILDSVKSERNVMETKRVFEETGKLGSEIHRLGKQLERVNKQCLEMMKLCHHEIVFKYADNHPRMLMIDGTYFCPACGKTVKCIQKEQLKESSFKDSRVIPLTNLSLFGTSKVHHFIRNEVYQNMDLYYNLNVPTEELSGKMEELLKNQENDYNKKDGLIRKRKK